MTPAAIRLRPRFPAIAMLVLLFFAAPRLAAEEEEPIQTIPDTGFFRALNLVGLTTPTYLSIGEREFNRGDPIEAGASPGLLALRPGEYSLTVRNEGARPERLSVPFTIENGRNLVIILFETVSTNSDGEETARLLHTRLTETLESDLPRLSLVSLLDDPVARVSLGPHRLEMRPQRAERVEVALEDSFYLRYGRHTLGEIVIAKKVHYLGFLFTDPESGEPALSLIENEKLEYHPPLEDED